MYCPHIYVDPNIGPHFLSAIEAPLGRWVPIERTFTWLYCARRRRMCLPGARSGRMDSSLPGWEDQKAMRPLAKYIAYFNSPP